MEEQTYELDMHGQFIMDDYLERLPIYEKMRTVAIDQIRQLLKRNHLKVTAIEARVKTKQSLAGKLALKGHKYAELSDITDILGTRIIAFYSDDVDRVASFIEKEFDVDWENSVDKRKMHQLDSFGYNSLHYICRIPKEMYHDEDMPQLNELRFEIQMRTTLQHVWATMYHDTGYKSEIEPPREYLRMLNRLAGMLELADDEFSRIRNNIANYRRSVQTLVKDGQLNEVQLNGDTWNSYLQLRPFSQLTEEIASINQAEIQEVPLIQFMPLLKDLGMQTLGDVDKMLREHKNDAYKLAMSQLADTDLDILSSSIGLQNLCIVVTLKNGGGKSGLKHVYDVVNGESPHNESLAEMVFQQASKLPFMNM